MHRSRFYSLTLLLCGSLVLWAPALAQQDGSGSAPVLKQGAPSLQQEPESFVYYLRHPEVPIPPAVKERAPAPVVREIERRQERQRRSETVAKDPRASSPTGLRSPPEVESGQSWVLNENPNPSLNFDLRGTPTFAGDVNGDGTNDYLYATSNARDERTPDVLEDQTGKTALFDGGTPSATEDQLVYRELHPAGDLNNDGRADAIEFENGSIRFWAGSSSGYVDTGTTISNPFGSGTVLGFTDLDGDGFEDALLFDESTEEEFAVVYGEGSFSQATVQTYTRSPGDVFDVTLNAADLTKDGSSEVIRLAGGASSIQLQVFEIDNTRTLTEAQSLVAEELNGSAVNYQLSLIDITGNGTLEIATRDRFASRKTYVFERDAGSGTYVETPDSLEKDAIPVGDLDGDGRHDFYTFDESTDPGTRYISYGPSDLSDGLTFDTEIPYGDDVFGTVDFLPQGGLGDVTGDGRPDVGLGLLDSPNETVGRRFFSVNSDRTGRTPADVSYPEGHFFDRIQEAQEIGDFDGDGTDDFALVRFDLRQIEVFYGGSPISQEPDLTIESPINEGYLSIASGDFNGDGTPDLAAGYSADDRIEIYLGGSGGNGQVDHVIDPNDFGFESLVYLHTIGDVNDDGADDLLTTDPGSFDDPSTIAVFFGGSTLPDAPGETFQYEEEGPGRTAAAPGDVNGDGIDDFVVGRPVFSFSDSANASGRADVYFGGSDPSFSSPDLTLRPEDLSDNITRFVFGLTGGDFDEDGYGDIAVRPLFEFDESGEGMVRIFRGGPGVDDQADQQLRIPVETGVGEDFDGDGLPEISVGILEAIELSGQPDVLIQGSYGPDGTNAVLYRPLGDDTEPTAVFHAPNQDAGLGGFSSLLGGVAAGEFTGSGRVYVVLPQTRDDNDAAQSSRVYRYEMPGNQSPTADFGFAPSVPQVGETVTFDASGSEDLDGTIETYDWDFGDGSGGGGVSETISHAYDSEGTYTVALTVTDGDGAVSEEATSELRIRPSQTQATATQSFGRGQKEDYRLVALPGQASATLSETISGDWRGFRETGASGGQAYSRSECSGDCQFGSGGGFWLIAGEAWQVDRTVEAAELSEGGTMEIGLQDGWNLVSNPLETDVSWSAVQQATGTSQPLWEFSGGWNEASTFESARAGTAYYFRDDQVSGLTVPFPGAGGASTQAKADTAQDEDGQARALTLSVVEGGEAVTSVRAGVRTEAKEGLDRFDHYGPPGYFGAATLRLLQQSSAEGSGEERPVALATEYREPGGDGHAFDLRLRAAADTALTLRAGDLGGFSGEEVSLVETATGEAHALQEGKEITILQRTAEARYRLLVGSEAYVEEKKRDVRPSEVKLLPNYPNPFARQTTIEYALPEAQSVRLAVYDVLGRQVAVLQDGRQEGGFHQVQWQADGELSSGTYFVRLRARGQSRTRRLTVVR